jgi:hypothetical protein
MKRTLGILILAAVFALLFSVTAQNHGVVEAVKGWGFALGLTAVVVSGVYLAVGDRP